jgi:uracil-DNA glycosylase
VTRAGAGQDAAQLIPARPTLNRLRRAARDCTACELWRSGTQTVFGQGPETARVLMLGEQPGDREDLTGRPFVGPAGKLLDRALADARLQRDEIYLTNAVKHFRWEQRGKQRIHRKPGLAHVRACRPWLDSEISVVAPEIVVCLGATAAQALLGPSFRLTKHRGTFVDSELEALVTATVHPSSILRAAGEAARRRNLEAFVEDLRLVTRTLRT